MKVRLFILLTLLLLTNCCFSQKNKFKITPPGTVQVNDTLFVDITEIANVDWREYQYFLQKYDSASVDKALPDTLVWLTDTAVNPFAEYYFRHPGFNSYPVVGISYEQAVAFCKWRTFAANFAIYAKENNFQMWKEHLNDSFPIKFYYRLPTKTEWEMLAFGKMEKDKYPYGYDSTYKKWKGKYQEMFNCIFPKKIDSPLKKCINYTAVTKSFFKNTSGTYNMIGNVAEMVIEKGIAKGGSFEHKLEDCKITNDQYYTKPERWLGFRCIAVIIR